MKKPPSINDLLSQIGHKVSAKSAPKGYLNIEQFSNRIGKARITANQLLLKLYRSGKVYRVRVGRFDWYGPFSDA